MSVNKPSSGDDEDLDYYDPIDRKDAYQGMEKLNQFLDTIPYFDDQVISQLLLLAGELTETGELAAAEACCRKALSACGQLKDCNYVRCDALAGLAGVVASQNRFAEAEFLLREAYDLADTQMMNQLTCWGIARQLELLFGSQRNQAESTLWKERADSLLKGHSDEIRRRSDGNS